MIDKDDAMAKERMAGLKALRDQAAADAERTQLALDSSGNQGVSPDMLKGFARKARERMRLDAGGYRRDHLRALAQRVEVADDEVRIMGSKSELLRTLVAASSVETAAFGVHSSVLKWRAGEDSNAGAKVAGGCGRRECEGMSVPGERDVLGIALNRP
ncbi:MAG: hypothetical protein AcusKO_45230 [Acuticoccus sp.]